jgi:hypothetical protein
MGVVQPRREAGQFGPDAFDNGFKANLGIKFQELDRRGIWAVEEFWPSRTGK